MAQTVAASPIQIPDLRHTWSKISSYQEKCAPSSCPSLDRYKQGAGIAKAYNVRSAGDDFATLGISPGTSKLEIKKAYRQLALQYHPDVCKEDHCDSKFKQIQIAYERAMVKTTASRECENYKYDSSDEPNVSVVSEGLMGVNDNSWEDWEEWMGWEGAGTRDYSSHINIDI